MGNLYKIVDGRTTTARKFAALVAALEEFPHEVFKDLAAEIVDSSPVDTGTYMDNHHVSDIGKRQYERGVVSSAGKPQRQAREPHADAALGRLYSEIDSMPREGRWAYFFNTSKHAPQVEDRYGSYDRARSLFPVKVAEAWSKVNGN